MQVDSQGVCAGSRLLGTSGRPSPVLHLVNGLHLLGAERVAAEIALQAPAVQYPQTIGLVNGTPALEEDFRKFLRGSEVGTLNLSGPGGTLALAARIGRYCRRARIAVVHSHGYKSGCASVLARPMCPGVTLVVTNHGYMLHTWRERAYRRIDLCMLRGFSKIVAVSDSVAQEMVDSGIDARKISVIMNGVSAAGGDLSQGRELRLELGVPQDAIVCGVTASLTPVKGHDDLLSALCLLGPSHSSLHIILLGEGPLRCSLEDRVRQLGLEDRVHFAGHRADARECLSTIDIFVLPSHSEGLPMALLEAMGAGVAIVATAVGAVPSVVRDGINGLLTPPAAPDFLASRIKALAEDPALRRSLGQVARETIAERFSSGRMAQAYLSVYDTAINQQ